MIELSFDQAKSIVDDLIREFGEDYTYTDPQGIPAEDTTCYYVHGDEPGCIAGQILYRAGVPLETLSQWDYPDGIESGQPIHAVLDGLGIDADNKTHLYLNELQWSQDFGETWSQANRNALDVVQ